MGFKAAVAAGIVAVMGLLGSMAVAGAPEGLITYQGRLENGGVPVHGTVSLRFTIVSHPTDTNSVVSGPIEIVDTTATDGLVHEVLDFGDVFSTGPRWLEIEVDHDGGVDNFVVLSPRVELHPVPFAIRALSADRALTADDDGDRSATNELNTAFGLVGSELRLTDAGGVRTVDLAPLAGTTFGDRSSLDASDGSPVDAVLVDDEGLVRIGDEPARAGLDVSRKVVEFVGPELLAELISGRDWGTGRPKRFALSDGILYVAAVLTDAVRFGKPGRGTIGGVVVFDVTDPGAPVLLATIKNGQGGLALIDGVESVAVNDGILYAVCRFPAAFIIMDVTDPANPLMLFETLDGTGDFDRIAGAIDVAYSNGLAFIVAAGDHALTIVDVSSPGTPVVLAEVVDNAGGFNFLQDLASVAVDGDFVYVVSTLEHALTIIDISNPAAPTLASVVSDGVGGFDLLRELSSVAVRDGRAYVGSRTDRAVTIIDVTNPASPVLLSTIAEGDPGFEDLGEVQDVAVDGNTLAITATGGVTVADITDPGSPAPLGTIRNNSHGFSALPSPGFVALEGGIIYATSPDIMSGDIPRAITIARLASRQLAARIAGDLLVDGNAYFAGGPDSTTVLIESDPMNDSPSHQPSLKFRQKGGTFQSEIGYSRKLNNLEIKTTGVTASHISLNPGGNVGIKNDSPAHPLQVGSIFFLGNGSGAHLTSGGTWTNGSSRSFKEGFEAVNTRTVLETLVGIPVTRWSYRGSDEGAHLGPVAEDFHAAFGLGGDARYISTVDADGVALAAIQGLNAKLEEENAALREKARELEARLEKLESLLSE